MPDLPASDANSRAANERVPKKGVGKYKWYLIGGLGVVAVLVFFFVNKSNSNANSGGTTSTSLDPATQAALQGALQYQGSGIGAASQVAGPQGPAGPAGPAGPTGPAGKPGAPPPKPKPVPGPKKKPVPPPKEAEDAPYPTNLMNPLAVMNGYHTVKAGDTLASIGSATNVHPSSIWTMNKHLLGNNPVPLPGMRLRIR